MGDLGMHALHLPLRAGWLPALVRAVLSDLFPVRPDGFGGTEPCDTWDNAVLLCEVKQDGDAFPLRVETKRIAPGETNTWSIEVDGTEGSIAYTTRSEDSALHGLPAGRAQAWSVVDLGSQSAYPRSRERSSSSGSRMRSSRCGRPTSTSLPTETPGCSSRFTRHPCRSRPDPPPLHGGTQVAAGRDYRHDRVTAAVVQRELRSFLPRESVLVGTPAAYLVDETGRAESRAAPTPSSREPPTR